MFQCEGYDAISCTENEYDKFDKIIQTELKMPITVNRIINNCDHCLPIPLDFIRESSSDSEMLKLNDYLSSLRNKVGVYHLWVEEPFYCQDHDTRFLRCAYVGKGSVRDRVASHIVNKWPKLDTSIDQAMIYISFYECENRMAKYLEQLFLDTYSFELNDSENYGTGNLIARWDTDMLTLGTEIHELSSILARKNNFE